MPVACKTKTFKVKSGKIGIGDPCYSSASILVEAKNGEWEVNVKKISSFGERVSEVIVHHKDFGPSSKLSTEEDSFGVDSGQAGVFDGDFNGTNSSFYSSCCDKTLSKKGYGFLDNGFVTSSGYGDGCYPCLIFKENGKAVCVQITFIETE